jgi:anaerobic selenocysteine-containing dehydrogenase
MKIDRRNFLSFLIGGAAGTTLSPLPWKLMDDSAIWTQMWPWTPVPEDGATSYVNSVCTLCPGGCGITVQKIDDRAIKIEGMKHHPVNDGGICMLGLSGLQLLYGPRRVKTPLKRVGVRGSGRWMKISWKDAIAETAKKLDEIRSNNQPHGVASISGSDRGTVPQLLRRFLNVYGSPNFIRTPSIQDSYELTLHLMQGNHSMVGLDLENADLVLSFGSGIIDGWGSPIRMIRAKSSWQRSGTKVIQVEPRLSNTAAKSDKWIPINTGTEAVLALGLAHVIIKESLYNSFFVENYSVGFDEWKRHVRDEYRPDTVEKITGIDEKTIITLARKFARASKPLAICGKGQGRTPGSLGEFMAVHALNALVGNINKEGGVWTVAEPDYIDWPGINLDDLSYDGMSKERLDDAGSKTYPFTRYLLNRFADAVDSDKKYPLKMLFIHDANPLYTMHDTQLVQKTFAKIPFIVSFSSYMNETAQYADLILPNHTYLERFEDVPTPTGMPKPVIGLSKPVVEPQFDTKHIGDVIILLARALGGNISDAFPWNNYEACLKDTLKDRWQTMIENGFWSDPYFRAPGWEASFGSPSEKFEFVNSDTGLMPKFAPINIEGDETSYPLVLVPYDSIRLANGFVGDPPFMVKTVSDKVLEHNDLFVEINPETAKPLGFAEGSKAVVSTPKSKANVRIHLFDGIMPGIIAMPTGLGHKGNDEYIDGKGVNYNQLVGPVEDPDSGLDVAWGIRARLSKA